jgi:hypothetical protein
MDKESTMKKERLKKSDYELDDGYVMAEGSGYEFSGLIVFGVGFFIFCLIFDKFL